MRVKIKKKKARLPLMEFVLMSKRLRSPPQAMEVSRKKTKESRSKRSNPKQSKEKRNPPMSTSRR